MRIYKRVFSLLLVLCFMFTFSVSALAADYTAATYDDIVTAFADESGEDVAIDVTEDILFDAVVTGKKGITYTIGSQNDSALHNAAFDGAGTVEVKTDLEGSIGLQAYGDVSVNVSGDIAAVGEGVIAAGNATVAVEGDIGSNANGVLAEDNASVTVNGNIMSAGADGVNAAGNAEVTVTGNVTGGDDGVEVMGNAAVTVTGSVTGEFGVFAAEDTRVAVTGDVTGNMMGVLVSGRANITVNGDVNGVVSADEEAGVTVDGNVYGTNGDPDEVDPADPEAYSDGGYGVQAYSDSTVTVTGDVIGGTGYGPRSYGGDGVYAQNNASVTVGGNVMGGDGGMTAGDGVDMDSTATVSVGGDVVGGDVESDEYGASGDGVTMEFEDPKEDDKPGSLTVDGSVIGGRLGNGLELDNDSELPLSELEIPSIILGSCSNIGFDDFTKAEAEKLLTHLNIASGLPEKINWPGEREEIIPEEQTGVADTFWRDVTMQILSAEKGAELTVDAGVRTTMPVYVLKLAVEREVTLIIQWDGGEDIVIKEAIDFEGNTIRLSELAELVK